MLFLKGTRVHVEFLKTKNMIPDIVLKIKSVKRLEERKYSKKSNKKDKRFLFVLRKKGGKF